MIKRNIFGVFLIAIVVIVAFINRNRISEIVYPYNEFFISNGIRLDRQFYISAPLGWTIEVKNDYQNDDEIDISRFGDKNQTIYIYKHELKDEDKGIDTTEKLYQAGKDFVERQSELGLPPKVPGPATCGEAVPEIPGLMRTCDQSDEFFYVYHDKATGVNTSYRIWKYHPDNPVEFENVFQKILKKMSWS